MNDNPSMVRPSVFRVVVFCFLLLCGAADIQAALVIYPLDPDHKSDGRVTGSLNGQLVTFEYQYTYRVNPASTLGQEDFKANYVRFAADGPVNVQLTINSAITNAFLRAVGKDLPFTRNGSDFVFTLPGPGNYYLQLPDLDTPGYISYTVFFCFDSLTNYNAYQQAFSLANNVTNHGVVSSPTLDQTGVIQTVLNSGGSIYFPSGIYRTGRLTNRSDTSVYLAPGAVIKGTDTYTNTEFLYLYGQQNFHLAGLGVIDPNGLINTLATGHGFQMELSTNVTIDDVLFRNSNSWMLPIRRSSQVQFHNLKIFSGKDGIDPDGSTDVLIEGTLGQSIDDGLCIKSSFSGFSCQNVTMRDCIVFSCASALKIGTETYYGNVTDITWDNCDAIGDRGCVITLRTNSFAPIANITWSNIRFFGFHYLLQVTNQGTGGTPFWFRDQSNVSITNAQVWNVVANPLGNCKVEGSNKVVTLRDIIMNGSCTIPTNGLTFAGVIWTNISSQSRPVVFITPSTRNQNEFCNGDLVTVTAQHPFGRAITQVQLFADGLSLGLRTNAPYQFTLTGLTNGLHQLQATATDADGSTNNTALKRILIVLPPASPRLDGINLSNGNLFITGTNGPAGSNCFLLASTNLALPLSNWARVATNPFNGGGNLVFTSSPSGISRRFFSLQLP